MQMHFRDLSSGAPRGKGPLTRCDSEQSLGALNLSPRSQIQRSSDPNLELVEEERVQKADNASALET